MARIAPRRIGTQFAGRRPALLVVAPSRTTVALASTREPHAAEGSSRAAILTPSPIRSPSLSSTTSPTWMPTGNSIRRSGGRPALRSTMPFCTSMAQRTASTTLLNSMMLPSPVRFATRPLCTAMVGSIRSLRSARRRASVRSSSDPASFNVGEDLFDHLTHLGVGRLDRACVHSALEVVGHHVAPRAELDPAIHVLQNFSAV